MPHTLTAQNISKTFKQAGSIISILENISVQFDQEKSYAIMGVSGVGKSTFMHILSGLEQPNRGAILFDGISIASQGELSQRSYLQKSIGLVFQNPYLIRELSVLENITLPALIRDSSAQDRAVALLERVGLIEKKESAPASLSVGQQQRVALCRALINEPAFLLADEPTGALDEKTGRMILDLLLELQEQLGMGLIVSTHDMVLANEMDEIYEIEDGSLNPFDKLKAGCFDKG